MTNSDQPGTGTQGSLDKSVKIGENVRPELTQDELNKVSGGAFDTYMSFRDSDRWSGSDGDESGG